MGACHGRCASWPCCVALHKGTGINLEALKSDFPPPTSSCHLLAPSAVLSADIFMSYNERQDEPFNHESVMRGHQRSESSANLLQGENTPTREESSHGDGFYDNTGPSKTTLYDDPERALPYDKEGQTRNYQNLGACFVQA